MAFAIAGAIAAVVGASIAAYSAYEAGQQQEQAATYQSKVAKNQAQAAKNASDVAEQNIREQDRRIMASQRALIGGAGLSTEGSPLLVMMDSAQQAQLDAMRARLTGDLQAGGLLDQARVLAYQGGQYAKAGSVTAGTSLLTGASNALRIYAGTRVGKTDLGIGYGAASTPPSGYDTPY